MTRRTRNGIDTGGPFDCGPGYAVLASGAPFAEAGLV